MGDVPRAKHACLFGTLAVMLLKVHGWAVHFHYVSANFSSSNQVQEHGIDRQNNKDVQFCLV